MWVFAAHGYTCNLSFEGGHTLLPRSIFKHIDITDSSFNVLMYIYQQAGNEERAFPCISGMCTALDMAMSTVCLGIVAIRKLSCILVQHCIMKTNQFTHNTYHLGTERKETSLPLIQGGSLSFLEAVQLLKLGKSEGQSDSDPCSYYTTRGNDLQDCPLSEI